MSGCVIPPTETSIQFGSENTVALRYIDSDDCCGIDLTPTAEIIDMAIKHCQKYNKGMKYLSGVNNGYSHEEIHTFQCTNDHADEKIEIEFK